MSTALIILATMVGITSFFTGLYISYKNYRLSRDSILSKIEKEERELLDDIWEIGFDELIKTEAGKELISMLAPEDISNSKWKNLGYRKAAIEMARLYEEKMLESGKDHEQLEVKKRSYTYPIAAD